MSRERNRKNLTVGRACRDDRYAHVDRLAGKRDSESQYRVHPNQPGFGRAGIGAKYQSETHQSVGAFGAFGRAIPRGRRRNRQSHPAGCSGRKGRGGHHHPAAPGRPRPTESSLTPRPTSPSASRAARPGHPRVLYRRWHHRRLERQPEPDPGRRCKRPIRHRLGLQGLAPGSAGGANYLYTANFHNGSVDVFDGELRVGRLLRRPVHGPEPSGRVRSVRHTEPRRRSLCHLRTECAPVGSTGERGRICPIDLREGTRTASANRVQ